MAQVAHDITQAVVIDAIGQLPGVGLEVVQLLLAREARHVLPLLGADHHCLGYGGVVFVLDACFLMIDRFLREQGLRRVRLPGQVASLGEGGGWADTGQRYPLRDPHQVSYVLGLVFRGRAVRDEAEVGRGALQAVKQAARWGGEIQRRQVFPE